MTKKKSKQLCPIVSNECLTKDVFDLWIACKEMAEEAQPGQFVALYCADGSRLLPRPISICETDRAGGRLRLVYRIAGAGTREIAAMRAGGKIAVLGPLGNGFPIEKVAGKRVFLIGGGIGIPPLLETAKRLMDAEVDIIAGYRDADTFLADDLAAAGRLYTASEDGSVGTKGNVLDAIRANGLTADIIFACGPMPMLSAVKDYAARTGILCYLSLEQRMACGVGACLGCVTKSTQVDSHSMVKNKRICKDGPVFEASEVDFS